MALSQTWGDPTVDPPYRKTGEVLDQTTIEGILNCLYALGGTDGTSGFAIPIGGQIPYTGSAVPSGGFWKICDGSAIQRTTYAKMFAIQSTTYGAGDGTTTFNLPDKRFRVSIGLDNMGSGAAGRAGSHTATQGGSGGEADHALTSGETGVHSHGVTDPNHGHGVTDPNHSHSTPASSGGGSPGENGNTSANNSGSTNAAATGVSVNAGATGISINNAGSGTAHNNLSPYQCDLYIVRVL